VHDVVTYLSGINENTLTCVDAVTLGLFSVSPDHAGT
jgi:hypothetical protein